LHERSRNGEGCLWRLLRRESNQPPQRVASSPARQRSGGGVMARCSASKNSDVPETSPDQIIQETKGSEMDLSPGALLFVVHPREVPSKKQRRRYRPHGSKHLSLAQATNMVEAVDYAREIGRPLVAHATIHWSGTVIFDDPNGKLFAKVR